MKKLLPLSIVCLLITVLFSSCNSKLTLTKRHYSKGYYVAWNKNKQVTPKPAEEKKATAVSATETVSKEVIKTSPVLSAPIINQNQETGSNAVAAVKPAKKTRTASPDLKTKINTLASGLLKTPTFTSVRNNTGIGKSDKVSASKDDDGLSLFWIIILVIVILWALGYGFGLGGLINLLLLIAVILLILWLLRII